MVNPESAPADTTHFPSPYLPFFLAFLKNTLSRVIFDYLQHKKIYIAILSYDFV
jgi:hypothetical protein